MTVVWVLMTIVINTHTSLIVEKARPGHQVHDITMRYPAKCTYNTKPAYTHSNREKLYL